MGYSLKQTIYSPSLKVDDFFGLRTSLYGNYLVVGDRDAKDDPNGKGEAYFYRINPSSSKFDLIQTIDSPSEKDDDLFGNSVSLYANYLVIGDNNADPDGNGAVYFYRINPSSGKFDLIQTIVSPSPSTDDNFSTSVSLYGNYLVVGDIDAKNTPTGKGAVYFYRINPSSGKFDLIQTIDSPSPLTGTYGDSFGSSVSLYGNYLVIGDRDAKDNPTKDKGAAYFYRINLSSGKFDLIQTIDSPSEKGDDQFGTNLSLYGNYLVVGDTNAVTGGDGAVYFYRINSSSGKFDLIQTIDSYLTEPNDTFGASVSLYGDYLVVGDETAKISAGKVKGAAYFYRINPSSGKFDLIQTIDSPSPGPTGAEKHDNFGTSVSLYGNYLIVGDYDADPDSNGTVYFYKIDR